MQVERTAIPGLLVITPKKHGDSRGFFSETFRADALADAGVSQDWVQDNHSLSGRRGVVRGLHYQTAPFVQAKLVRVIRGAILDVAVDIRLGSPTYGRHFAIELSADNWKQVYVPGGFAHGFETLSDTTEVLYKVTAPYSPANEGGLRWDDPSLDIDWTISPEEAALSQRDQEWPAFAKFDSPFSFDRRLGRN
jgi:dTDP-4-dehydrorhamnose 3,5-epimerase